jgi:GTP-binding protein
MYDEDLSKFPWIVVANKMDLEGAAENLEIFKQRFPKVKIIPMSAEKEEGLDGLRDHLDEAVGYHLHGTQIAEGHDEDPLGSDSSNVKVTEEE